MSEQFDSIYWRGQGPAFLAARAADGSAMGFEFLGDIDTIEGTPNISRVNVKENVSGQRRTAASFITDASYPITINFKSVKPEHAAKALQADLTTVASGSVTDQSHTGYHDKMIMLDHVKVSSVVVSDDPETAPYTVDTDYIVHADEGMIEILSTGSISDAEALLIDYSYAAQKVLKQNSANQEYMLMFAGMNTTNGDKQGRCVVHKLTIDPAFMSMINQDTEGSMSVGAEMLVDTLRSDGDQMFTWVYED